MSTVFAILTVLTYVLKGTGLSKKMNRSKFIHSFYQLVSLMYWWPNPRDSDTESIEYVHSSPKYYIDLNTNLNKFIDNLQSYCKSNSSNASNIDKPNVHCLIKLVTSAIPTFRHCVLFAELPFESYHWCIKANISKSTNSGAHITTMKCIFYGLAKEVFNGIRGCSERYGKKDGYNNPAKRVIPDGVYFFHDDFVDALAGFRNAIFAQVSKEWKLFVSHFTLIVGLHEKLTIEVVLVYT